MISLESNLKHEESETKIRKNKRKQELKSNLLEFYQFKKYSESVPLQNQLMCNKLGDRCYQPLTFGRYMFTISDVFKVGDKMEADMNVTKICEDGTRITITRPHEYSAENFYDSKIHDHRDSLDNLSKLIKKYAKSNTNSKITSSCIIS